MDTTSIILIIMSAVLCVTGVLILASVVAYMLTKLRFRKEWTK